MDSRGAWDAWCRLALDAILSIAQSTRSISVDCAIDRFSRDGRVRGTYSIPAGAADDQVPHAEDEIYVVLSGRGTFTAGGRTIDALPGRTLFVPAGEDHRFHDVAEDMTILVFFAPAYTGRP